jgi:hypothetical protein
MTVILANVFTEVVHFFHVLEVGACVASFVPHDDEFFFDNCSLNYLFDLAQFARFFLCQFNHVY